MKGKITITWDEVVKAANDSGFDIDNGFDGEDDKDICVEEYNISDLIAKLLQKIGVTIEYPNQSNYCNHD